MKNIPIALLLLTSLYSWKAHAEIYKCHQKSGEMVFFDENSKPQDAQCELIFKDKPASKPTAKTASTQSSLQAQNFPSVDAKTQQKRDLKRKQILLNEFDLEAFALKKAQASGLESEVLAHQKNILLLKKEIDALK